MLLIQTRLMQQRGETFPGSIETFTEVRIQTMLWSDVTCDLTNDIAGVYPNMQ